jgi:hypothetical protein
VKTISNWRVAGLALVAALMALQLAAALDSLGTYDTVRDIFYARAIATGAERPSTGPVIGDILHRGPVCYRLPAAAGNGSRLEASGHAAWDDVDILALAPEAAPAP